MTAFLPTRRKKALHRYASCAKEQSMNLPAAPSAPDDTIARDAARAVASVLARRFASVFADLKRGPWLRIPFLAQLLAPVLRHIERTERLLADLFACLAEGNFPPEPLRAARPNEAPRPGIVPPASTTTPPAPTPHAHAMRAAARGRALAPSPSAAPSATRVASSARPAAPRPARGNPDPAPRPGASPRRAPRFKNA